MVLLTVLRGFVCAGLIAGTTESVSAQAVGEVFRDCEVCPEMVVVPPGSFMMGSPATEQGRGDSEGPQHQVTIGYPLAVGRYEVMFLEWDACQRDGGCVGEEPNDRRWGRGRRPVIGVSMAGAKKYLEWLSGKTGQEYRLLSEAEWEYAARAGTQTARYWGESESGQCRYANGNDDDAPCDDGHEFTAPVGSYEPNAFGLYDVLGNVAELVDGCWNRDYEGAPTDGTAWQPSDTACRIPAARGSAWSGVSRFLRSAYRGWVPTVSGFWGPSSANATSSIGFRVARTQELPPEIQADRFLMEAERRIGNRDFAAALAALDRIVALQAEHDIEMPPEFLVRRAHVAVRTGQYEEAISAATQYLQQVGRAREDYAAVVEVLNEADGWLAEGVFRDCPVCPVVIEVPAGSYLMGSSTSEPGRSDDEGPGHRVMIDYPLVVGVHEVTFDEWEACVRGGSCEDVGDAGWGRGRRPVINVSWDHAQAYVRWLSKEAGQRYRLLSEAEWEYMARAGTEMAHHWGNTAAGQCRYANGPDASALEKYPDWVTASCSDGYSETAPVGSFEPNAFGVYDALGNVAEWTEDCWNGSYSGAPTDGSIWRSGDCSQRVFRGGSWHNDFGDLRSASRGWASAGARGNNAGFRVARRMR